MILHSPRPIPHETTPAMLDAIADAPDVGVTIVGGCYHAVVPIPGTDRAVDWWAAVEAS